MNNKVNTQPYDKGTYKTNPFIPNPNENTSFKTNIVFASLPIGNPGDISVNVIEHIQSADIILVESHREFARLITRLNDLRYRVDIDIQPSATIYQCQYESEPGRDERIYLHLINEAQSHGRKVLVCSDEGSSVFLEPGQKLKDMLVRDGIPYTVLPGPFSGFSSVTNSDFFVRQFFFGESLPAIPKEARLETYKRMHAMASPTVFLLTAVDARWCIEELYENFPENWTLDFQMSLTMDHEKHVYGSFDQILEYIDYNTEIFQSDDQQKKFAVLLFPDESLQIVY